MSSNSIWDEVVAIDKSDELKKEVEELQSIANRLWDELSLDDNRLTDRFTPWEYTFIHDMYNKDKSELSDKQKENLYRLEEKYL